MEAKEAMNYCKQVNGHNMTDWFDACDHDGCFGVVAHCHNCPADLWWVKTEGIGTALEYRCGMLPRSRLYLLWKSFINSFRGIDGYE